MILYNHRITAKENIEIDIEDRAYQFGDGVYEVIRVYYGKPFYLEEHLLRLMRSAQEVKIPLPYSLEELKAHLFELIQVNKLQEGNIYIQISRGVAPRNHSFSLDLEPVLIAYCQPNSRPIEDLKQGVSAFTAEDIRWLRCDIKSLNLLGAVLAKQAAVDQGGKESILIRDGIVTEGSSTNIFIVKDGTLITHPANHLILHGITRKITIQLADMLGINVKEETFSKEDLFAADECMMTSTTMEVCPITHIDQQSIGTGEVGLVTRQLQEAFEKQIKSHCK